MVAGGAQGASLTATVRGELAEPVVLETLSDAEVMLRVAAGDDTAFDYLVEKYRRPMVSFMYRMTHNQAVAEELAQEVFLRVYRSRKGYEASAKFTTWLYRIATNLSVNHARDTKYERPENTVNIDEPDTETGMTVDVADSGLNAEQNILRRERLTAIRLQVEALPERQRMAVLMHKYQNMDYKQIAAVLKLSESATKSLLFRAYETLARNTETIFVKLQSRKQGAVMRCEKLRQEFMEMVLGETETASPEVQKHVENCASCAAELASLRQTMSLLDEWSAPEPSPYFNTRLMARVREEAQAPAQGLDGLGAPSGDCG